MVSKGANYTALRGAADEEIPALALEFQEVGRQTHPHEEPRQGLGEVIDPALLAVAGQVDAMAWARIDWGRQRGYTL